MPKLNPNAKSSFDPSQARGMVRSVFAQVFAPVESVDEEIAKEPILEAAPKPAKQPRAKSQSFKAALGEFIRDEATRTHFRRDALEYYLPQDLRLLYKIVTAAAGSRVPNDDKAKELMAFVRDEIYGRLPDYTSDATVEQASGYVINGKPYDLKMESGVAFNQVRELLQETKVNRSALLEVAEVRLKEHFFVNALIEGQGNNRQPVSREMVAKLVGIVGEMTQGPK